MTFDKERCKNCARNFFCEMGAECTVSDEVEITDADDADRVFLKSDGSIVHREYQVEETE